MSTTSLAKIVLALCLRSVCGTSQCTEGAVCASAQNDEGPEHGRALLQVRSDKEVVSRISELVVDRDAPEKLLFIDGTKQEPDLTEDGFKAMTLSCCHYNTDQYIRATLNELTFDICDQGCHNGFTPFFSCTPDHTLQSLKATIFENSRGLCPCYAPRGDCKPYPDDGTCPLGEYNQAAHRRRICNQKKPTEGETEEPTEEEEPTDEEEPTEAPTEEPTEAPTVEPTTTPPLLVTETPSPVSLTVKPPVITPVTPDPSSATLEPTEEPTEAPTEEPTTTIAETTTATTTATEEPTTTTAAATTTTTNDPNACGANVAFELKKADTFCSPDPTKTKSVTAAQAQVSIQGCADAVSADKECGTVFWGREGHCDCVRDDSICQENPSTAGNSLYQLRMACGEICEESVSVIGGTDPAYMGSYIKTGQEPEEAMQGRPIFKNAEGMFLYYWDGEWLTGAKTDGENAVYRSGSDTKCPEFAIGWSGPGSETLSITKPSNCPVATDLMANEPNMYCSGTWDLTRKRITTPGATISAEACAHAISKDPDCSYVFYFGTHPTKGGICRCVKHTRICFPKADTGSGYTNTIYRCPCSTTVEVKGATHQSSRNGLYKQASVTPTADQDGRPIYQHAGSDSFLFYWKPRKAWHIGFDYTSSDAGIINPKCDQNTGTSCPDEASAWQIERPESGKAWWEWNADAEGGKGAFVEGDASVTMVKVTSLLQYRNSSSLALVRLNATTIKHSASGDPLQFDSVHDHLKLDDDINEEP